MKRWIDRLYVVASVVLIAAGLNNFYSAFHGIGILEVVEIQIAKQTEWHREETENIQEQEELELDDIEIPHEHVWEMLPQYIWLDNGDGTGQLMISEEIRCACGARK